MDISKYVLIEKCKLLGSDGAINHCLDRVIEQNSISGWCVLGAFVFLFVTLGIIKWWIEQ